MAKTASFFLAGFVVIFIITKLFYKNASQPSVAETNSDEKPFKKYIVSDASGDMF